MSGGKRQDVKLSVVSHSSMLAEYAHPFAAPKLLGKTEQINRTEGPAAYATRLTQLAD